LVDTVHYFTYLLSVSVFAAAELGDCEDEDSIRNFIEQPQLLPRDAVQHSEDIIREYKTLASV